MESSVVLRLVSGALQDLEPGIAPRWSWDGDRADRVGLLDFLNAALGAVAMQRPDCRAVTESLRLEPGIRQRLPTKAVHGASCDAVGFCELVRNMGADGKTPGRPITSVRQEVLMSWVLSTARTGDQVDNFAYDRSTNPGVYYVWPGVPEGGVFYVEGTYHAAPARIASPEQDLGIADGYAQALAHHMLGAIFGADNSSSGLQKAEYHMRRYQEAMNAKLQADVTLPRAKNSIG